MFRAKRKVSIISMVVALIMLLTMSVSALELQRYMIDPSSVTRSTIKDTYGPGNTSVLNVQCVGNLVYYGYTGYSAETTAASNCTNVYARVDVYNGEYGWWDIVDTDDASNTTSANAADQYGSGVERSRGFHYVKDNGGGTWGSKISANTSYAYPNG